MVMMLNGPKKKIAVYAAKFWLAPPNLTPRFFEKLVALS